LANFALKQQQVDEMIQSRQQRQQIQVGSIEDSFKQEESPMMMINEQSDFNDSQFAALSRDASSEAFPGLILPSLEQM